MFRVKFHWSIGFTNKNVKEAAWSTNKPPDLPKILRDDLVSYKLFFVRNKIHILNPLNFDNFRYFFYMEFFFEMRSIHSKNSRDHRAPLHKSLGFLRSVRDQENRSTPSSRMHLVVEPTLFWDTCTCMRIISSTCFFPIEITH